MPIISSIQIGQIQSGGDPDSRAAENRFWTSAFDKRPVPSRVTIGPLGIEGDEVADKVHHGGPDKAILCYAGRHYASWRDAHPDLDFGPGGFGENLTIDEADESEVCIGDRFDTDHCRLEVSQPRQPCWKISRRWATKTLTKEVAQSGRTGWYVRVLQGGVLAVGETMRLSDRPHPNWTIARANDLLFGRDRDPAAIEELKGLAVLANAWKADLV